MKHMRIFAVLASLITVGAPVAAQVMENVAKLSVRSGWSENANTHVAGLQIDLAPGWKTYWRQPGDAGIPAQFTWSGSKNIDKIQVLWPRPKVTWDYGMRSLVYETRVVLPLIITTKGDGPMNLKGRVMIGVCEDVCIPVEYKINTRIPRNGTSDRALQTAIDAQPVVKRTKVTCEFAPYKTGLKATLSIKTPKLGAEEHMAVEFADPDLWVGTPALSRQGGTLKAEVTVLANSGQMPLIDRAGLRTTLIAGTKAVEFRGCQAR